MIKTHDTRGEAEHALLKAGYRRQTDGSYITSEMLALIHPVPGGNQVRVTIARRKKVSANDIFSNPGGWLK